MEMRVLKFAAPLALTTLLTTLPGQTVYPWGPYDGGYGTKTNPGTLPQEPLATFRGIVQGAGPKLLAVKTEADTLDFECSKKTTYRHNGKKVNASVVKPGDPVAVEAKHTIDGKVMAVNVIIDPPPEKPANPPSGAAQK